VRRTIAAKRRYLALLCFALLAETALAAPRMAFASKTAEAPAIDGKLDDLCWRQAPVVSGFLRQPSMKQPALAETEVRIVYDDKCVYFGFSIFEPDKGKKFVAQTSGRDARIWLDDIVEIFLDVLHDGGTYYQICTNSGQGTYDGYVKNRHWNGAWRNKSITSPGLWRMEVEIPFRTLGRETPSPGAVWGMNITRTRRKEARFYSYWSPVGLNSHSPELFGDLIFGDSRQWAGGVIEKSRLRLKAAGELASKHPFLGEEIAGDLARYKKALGRFARAAARAKAHEADAFPGLYDQGRAVEASIVALGEEVKLAMKFECLRR